MPRRNANSILTAVDQRIGAALEALELADEGSRVERLGRLVDHVAASLSGDELWLLFVAVSGAFPASEEVVALRRRLELADDTDARIRAVLDETHDLAIERGAWDRPIRIVSDRWVVDVDFCAKHEHNTGIQRVVRETVARWTAGRDVELAAWIVAGSAMRGLYPHERDRVVRWGAADRDRSDPQSPYAAEIVVPWRTRLVIPEVPAYEACDRLAAIAEHTSTSVHLVGYDTIPIGSADQLPSAESERFGRYLSLVKHASLVATISGAVAEEFTGFAEAVRVQGLPGPDVRAVPLPAEFPVGEVLPAGEHDPELVLCVGSHEGRKNQRSLLHAAEILRREGRTPRFVFVGGGSIGFIREFDREARELVSRGCRIEIRRSVSDAELAHLYATAAVSVFPSLQEGFGLPVVESLAHGTPVITTGYGSTQEIAADGGCLVIDPRDDDALVDALRRVLADGDVRAELSRQALARPPRRWSDYANELAAAIEESA